MKQFTDALGDTKSAMWVMIGSNVINIVLNYVFIFLLDFGLTGAGLATLVARFFMPFAMFAAARRTMRKHQLLSAPSPARPTYKGTLLLLRLGFPISIQLCLEAGSFNICAIFMGWLGATALAAHQVMCTVATVAFMLYYGIGAAAAIRIAHYRGLGDLAEIRKTASAAFLMAFIPGMLIVLAVCLFRHSVVSIFTTSPEVHPLHLPATMLPLLPVGRLRTNNICQRTPSHRTCEGNDAICLHCLHANQHPVRLYLCLCPRHGRSGHLVVIPLRTLHSRRLLLPPVQPLLAPEEQLTPPS